MSKATIDTMWGKLKVDYSDGIGDVKIGEWNLWGEWDDGEVYPKDFLSYLLETYPDKCDYIAQDVNGDSMTDGYSVFLTEFTSKEVDEFKRKWEETLA